MLKGTIVENSLKDKSILDKIQIEKTWQDGDWTLHDIHINESDALEFGKYLNDGPWYIHLWKPETDDILVVFKNKNFRIKYSDESTWIDAVQYGKSIGIPDEQLDFLKN